MWSSSPIRAKGPKILPISARLRLSPLCIVRGRCAACIFQRLLTWHDSWCPPTVCGGRPGSDALQTALKIGLIVEEAIALHQRGLLLVSLDLSKFFDSIEWAQLVG